MLVFQGQSHEHTALDTHRHERISDLWAFREGMLDACTLKSDWHHVDPCNCTHCREALTVYSMVSWEGYSRNRRSDVACRAQVREGARLNIALFKGLTQVLPDLGRCIT